MYLQDKVLWVEATGLGPLEFQGLDLDRHGGPDNLACIEKSLTIYIYSLLILSK